MKPNRLLSIVTVLVLCIATQAQQPISQITREEKQASDREKIDVSTLLAQTRNNSRRAFSLMPSSRVTNTSGASFNITPMAAGPNLTVLGGGTLGRLTKWTGFTSSNSFIGDSTIFEDKLGKVGIGTDTPTSKLTVAGAIEITLGGLKFPDGTVQTTSAAGSLSAVAHNATLTGDGTAASPLGVAVPLVLDGAGGLNGVIQAYSTDVGGRGVRAVGGSSGIGVIAFGGGSNSSYGGDGVVAQGGGSSSSSSSGGAGVTADGGGSSSGPGGSGVEAIGGQGSGAGNSGGYGISARGGNGINGATPGLAGFFSGDVVISGKLMVTSGMKMFHIDHPLDPENKYLNHAAIESSEILNVYSGNVITDGNGDATVTLPDWFEAMNRDFRYQLTVVGTFAQAIVGEEIKGNRFTIKSNTPSVKVSWQVTGVRSDPTTRKYKFEAEEEKGERERGSYLNPDAYGQPEERSIRWARDPEWMQQLKQRRMEAERTSK